MEATYIVPSKAIAGDAYIGLLAEYVHLAVPRDEIA
jgi:hypothetical protein